MTPVVAICNQKGGVGKTALTTALASVLSSRPKPAATADSSSRLSASTPSPKDDSADLPL